MNKEEQAEFDAECAQLRKDLAGYKAEAKAKK